MRRSKPPAIRPASEDQTKRFIETARALGCNEDEGAFRDVLRRVGQHKPKVLKLAPVKPPKRGHREKAG